MKTTFVSFKTANGNKVFSNNSAVINSHIITEECLNFAIDVEQRLGENIWDMLAHKTMYISYPKDCETKKNYVTLKVLVVKRTNGEIMLWSNRYLKIEQGDVIFTELDEAAALTEKHQDYERLISLREFLTDRVDKVTKNIDVLTKELGK